jgi:hypothetical protein
VYKETFPIAGRLRYTELAPFLPRLLDPAYPSPIEVVEGRVVDSSYDYGDYLIVCEQNGERRNVSADAVINATGFDRSSLEAFFPDARGAQVYKSEDVGFARCLAPDIYAVGAAANIPVSDAERRLWPVLRNGQLPENVDALFRTIPQAELLGLRLAKREKPAGSRREVFPVRKSATRKESRLEEFGRYLDGEDGIGADLSVTVCHLRMLVAAFAEDIFCSRPIAITIEYDGFGSFLRSKEKLPEAVITKVLTRIFENEEVRRNISHVFGSIRSMYDALPSDPSASSTSDDSEGPDLLLSIPMVGNRLWAEGLVLAPVFAVRE